VVNGDGFVECADLIKIIEITDVKFCFVLCFRPTIWVIKDVVKLVINTCNWLIQ